MTTFDDRTAEGLSRRKFLASTSALGIGSLLGLSDAGEPPRGRSASSRSPRYASHLSTSPKSYCGSRASPKSSMWS